MMKQQYSQDYGPVSYKNKSIPIKHLKAFNTIE